MSWNVLNMGANSTDRFAHYRTVTDSLRPEVLVLQEVQGLAGAQAFQAQVLYDRPMAMAPFQGGPDSHNTVFYDTAVFACMGSWAYATLSRNIDRVALRHRVHHDTLHVLSVHLKSSTGSSNEATRATEADTLLKALAALPPGAYYVVCGDYNIYGSDEPAYQRLTTDPGNGRYLIDPEPLSGTWNNAAYAPYHTQSPRTRSFGGGASGGMDDRFDMILHAPTLHNGWGSIAYVEGSTWAVGNDGQHFNDSVNGPPNASVSQQMADALHYAADHLPVVARFHFTGTAGLAPTEGPMLRLWPNPTVSGLRISANSPLLRIEMTDATGRTVWSQHMDWPATHIESETSFLSPGLYVLRAETDSGRVSARFVKE